MNYLATALFIFFQIQPPAHAEEVFEVHDAIGKKTEGALKSWIPDSGVALIKEGKELSVTKPALVIRKNVKRSTPLGKNALLLSRGDSISFTEIQFKEEIIKLTGSELEFIGKDGGISVLEARLIWWDKPQGVTDRTKYIASVAQISLKKDLLILRNSDRLEGVLDAIDKEIIWEGAQGKVKYPPSRVGAIAFTQDGLEIKPVPRQACWISLKTGARFILEKSTLNNGFIQGEIAGQSLVKIPLHQLEEAIWLENSRFVHSSSGKVVEWPLFPQRDLFFIGGNCFSWGIPMKGSTSIKIPLNPGEKGFRSWIGMDEIQGRLGKGDFWVRSKGKELARWPGVSLASGFLEVNLDISNCSELEFGVEMSPGIGGFQQANWAHCIITR